MITFTDEVRIYMSVKQKMMTKRSLGGDMLGLIMSCSGVLLAWCDEAILHAFERIMIPNMQERPRPIF